MRWVPLLGVLGVLAGCTRWAPPPAVPAAPEPRAAADLPADQPAPPLTVRQVDPQHPRSVCDDKGAPVSAWPDALVQAANAMR